LRPGHAGVLPCCLTNMHDLFHPHQYQLSTHHACVVYVIIYYYFQIDFILYTTHSVDHIYIPYSYLSSFRIKLQCLPEAAKGTSCLHLPLSISVSSLCCVF
jgi:hypothetical protein